MPRFAVLAHDFSIPHWDLFLEAGPVLRSWRLNSLPVADSRVRAEPMPDHRLLYLDYEGPVSGGRGSVARVDAGEFVWEADKPHRIVVRLSGSRYIGRLTLERGTCLFHPS